MKTFVSYRRSDGAAAARQLADALAQRFGAESVFFDTQDLRPGTDWHREITDRVAAADVVLAVIGPQWVAIADARGRRRVLDPDEEDVLRTEVEAALRGPGRLVPVLVDDAVMPGAEVLPRPFKPVARLQGVPLRHGTWDQDVAALLDALAAPPPPAAANGNGSPQAAVAQEPVPPWEPSPGGPDEWHYGDVIAALEESSFVPVLGSQVHDGQDGPWTPGCGRQPSSPELAEALLAKFRLTSPSRDLAGVAQQVIAVAGPSPLDRALRELLLGDGCPPSPSHDFLARLPGQLRAQGREAYQLLVTTTYDTALERALDAVNEPFDLAVFIAAGPDRGRFLHVPWWDAEGREPEAIARPNEYVGFPIDDEGRLERTLVLKIHGGAVHDAPRGLRLDENFVITEDDYIGFLSESPIESLVPVQLLNQLREGHLLFLGYGVRDWNLRVFLRRVLPDGKPGATSWTVGHGDRIDHGFWKQLVIDGFDVPLEEYLRGLDHFLRGGS